jgi:hypothetical protein
VRARLLRRRIGARARVLVEGGGKPPPGYQRARSADYLTVMVPVSGDRVGTWSDVEYLRREGDTLIARTLG